MSRKGTAGRRLAPRFVTEVTARLRAGRLLLFCYTDNQVCKRYEHNQELEQFRICNHSHHPLPNLSEGEKLPSAKRDQPLPLLAVPSSVYHIF